MIVHVILNSHLDPVWLWKREQGIDEVLSTASSACDMLEDYPEIHITRGESWFYETIEEIDPALFERIRKFVAAGRWHIVGGWYVQPDCNLASPETYRRHGEIGTAYFREKFGVAVKTGYNVDSFGHGVMLPSFYRHCGIENYVMMRPNKTEMTTLPANDFRWRAADGSEVLTSRIIESYNSNWETIESHFAHTLEAADPELGHVMCFCGLGDHGGGPARIEIDWLLKHRHDRPGVEVRFSHPDAYFEAVRASGVKLPVFSGELQHHAVGCYAAESRIKHEVRTAENALINAGRFLPDAKRDELWKKVLFNTFHDVLAGSSVASAYPDLYDSLGHVRDEVNEATVRELRRRNAATPRCEHQRLFFDNLGDRDFSGMVECTPWLGFERWCQINPENGISLLDEQGRAVPFQRLPGEAPGEAKLSFHLVLELDIPRRGRRVLQLVLDPATEFPGRVGVQGGTLSTADVTAKCEAAGLTSLTRNGRSYLAAPVELQVIDDPSDTWSHGLVGYPVAAKRTFVHAQPWRPRYSGGQTAALGSEWNDAEANRATAICRVEAGVPGVQLQLRLDWHGTQELVKLVLRPAFAVRRRMDGCPGGAVERRLNGEEYPLFNSMTLIGDDRSLTLVSPDICSADVQPDGTVRLTLLRSPYYACSTENGDELPEFHHFPVMDQGLHDYAVWLLPDAAPETVEREIYRFTQPVKFSESTVGMGDRLTRYPAPPLGEAENRRH